ncbi:MAG TPA: hypothetical protein VHB99_13300 [Pirellulales bacterium]|nr:hypothetical protein [Pirellulales bacterium]
MNPFSTRFVRPGALPYFFRNGECADQLAAKFAAQGWRGQIIGPHGSGKSTLLAALAPAIDRSGRKTIHFALHDGERRLPIGKEQSRMLSAGDVLVIDGFEQLSAWNRWQIRRLCRRRGCGLLVTAHADAGLPDLFRTETDRALARRLVERLAPGDESIAAGDIDRAFSARGGDLRETLFELYDLYEQRRLR